MTHKRLQYLVLKSVNCSLQGLPLHHHIDCPLSTSPTADTHLEHHLEGGGKGGHGVGRREGGRGGEEKKGGGEGRGGEETEEEGRGGMGEEEMKTGEHEGREGRQYV